MHYELANLVFPDVRRVPAAIAIGPNEGEPFLTIFQAGGQYVGGCGCVYRPLEGESDTTRLHSTMPKAPIRMHH